MDGTGGKELQYRTISSLTAKPNYNHSQYALLAYYKI